MSEPTKREKSLLDAKTAILNAARTIDIDWPLTMLNNPMVSADKDVLCRAYRYDMDRLKQAAEIIDAMMVDADGFAVLFELAAKKKWAFNSCVLLAKQELAATDAQVAA